MRTQLKTTHTPPSLAREHTHIHPSTSRPKTTCPVSTPYHTFKTLSGVWSAPLPPSLSGPLALSLAHLCDPQAVIQGPLHLLRKRLPRRRQLDAPHAPRCVLSRSKFHTRIVPHHHQHAMSRRGKNGRQIETCADSTTCPEETIRSGGGQEKEERGRRHTFSSHGAGEGGGGGRKDRGKTNWVADGYGGTALGTSEKALKYLGQGCLVSRVSTLLP